MASEETKQLLASAEAFAAGKTLGLSEEEVLAAISRQARADMRQYQPAGYLGSGLTRDEVVNDLIRKSNQRAAQLGKVPDVLPDVNVANLQKRGSGQRKSFVGDTQKFTEADLTDMQNPIAQGAKSAAMANVVSGSDRYKEAQVAPDRSSALKARIEQELSAGRSPREIRAMKGYGNEVEYLLDQVMAEKYPSYRARSSKKQALQKEINKRKAERRKSGRRVFDNELVSLTKDYGAETTEFGSRPRLGLEEDPMTGEMVYAVDRAREPSSMRQEYPIPRVGREITPGVALPPSLLRDEVAREELRKMRQASADLRSAEDARMSNPDMQAVNYYKAMTDARDALLSGTVGQDIKIPSNRNLPTAVLEDFGPFGKVYVDPSSGQAITPGDYAISGANTPDSGQMYNAPQGATEFVTKQVFEGSPYSRDAAGNVQDMPSVSVTAEIAGLDDAVARLGQSKNFKDAQLKSDGIRTFNALEQTISAIKAIASQRNNDLVRVDPKTGKRGYVPASEATYDDVFSTLKIGPAQKERIVIALAQLGAAGEKESTFISKYLQNLQQTDTKKVVNLERPGRFSLLSGGKSLKGGGTQGATIIETGIPIKRMPEGGKTSFRKDLEEAGKRQGPAMSSNTESQPSMFGEPRYEVVNPGGRISSDAAAPFMGVASEMDPDKPGQEKAAPGTTSVSRFEIENIGEIEPRERIRRLEQKLGKGAFVSTSAELGPEASRSDVISAMENKYVQKVGKSLDEESLSKTVGRKQSLASREAENAAMGRLLAGDLAPGPVNYDPDYYDGRYVPGTGEIGRRTPPSLQPDPTEAQASPPASTPPKASSPIAAEARKRRIRGISPATAVGAGAGLLTALGLSLGGED